jgi:hypothetical protein
MSMVSFLRAVWDSAIVLSKYIEKWPAKVCGKRCIELGAGCGLPGKNALVCPPPSPSIKIKVCKFCQTKTYFETLFLQA